MALVLVLLTFHTLTVIAGPAAMPAACPPTRSINHRIGYEFDDERNMMVPVDRARSRRSSARH